MFLLSLKFKRDDKEFKKQAKMSTRILSRIDLLSSISSKFGSNAISKGPTSCTGEGGRCRPGSRARPSHAAVSEESCGVLSKRPSMKDFFSSTRTSCTDMSSNLSSSSVQSFEENTSSTSSRLLDQEVQQQEEIVSSGALNEEWGHFVDFQEEPDVSWVDALLNRHAQKRKAQQRV